MHSAPTSHYNPQQAVYPVNVPEYTISRPDLYLQHPNTSLQSLLSAETASVSSPTSSVSSEFEMYGDDAEFYLSTASPIYNPYGANFEADWTQYPPSSPDGSIQFFDSPMMEQSALRTSPAPPAKRQRKSQPEPCTCVYCAPTTNPASSSAASIHHNHHNNMINGVVAPRKNVAGSGGGVMQASPPLQLQFQIDIQPKPIIIGHHGLGADAAFLHQSEQIMPSQTYDIDTHYYAHGY